MPIGRASIAAHGNQVRLTTVPRLVEFAQLLCKQRYEGWRRTLNSPVAAVADPLETVVDREMMPTQFVLAIDWLTRENNRHVCIRPGARTVPGYGTYPVCIRGARAQSVQH